jgi:hypothetical protein
MPTQPAVNLLFNIPAHTTCHIIYISHNKGVLWYTRGYIPDISPRDCGGLAESRIGSNKNIPKFQTHIFIELICWPAQANFISCHHRQCLRNSHTWYAALHWLSQNTIVPFLAISTLCLSGHVSSTLSVRQCRNTTLPSSAISILCLLGCFASWVALPLGLLCLSGLPLGLLCLLGLALGLLLPLGLYIDTLPLRLCLIDIVCFDNAGILICLLGYAITGHLLVCQLISYVNMSNRDTMLDQIW